MDQVRKKTPVFTNVYNEKVYCDGTIKRCNCENDNEELNTTRPEV